ncbi:MULTISPECIES: putative holin-like toxin [Enterococcus]|nr:MULTISPECIES: putative holin-like toxin [Enterococcus]MDO6296673.1 putative holin-like toxin [Enterococcus gallinarum]MDT2677950.1 putative holin-like toxin [Enterococcus gallinarum]MDT2683428.1 putative holin-like toxin [Enterococcus gallinarum]
MSVFEALTLMIAFATLVLLITENKNQKK